MKSRRKMGQALAFRAAFVRKDEEGKSLITIDTAKLAVQYAKNCKNAVPVFRRDGVTFIGYDRRSLNEASVREIKQKLLKGGRVRNGVHVADSKSSRPSRDVKMAGAQ